MSKDNACCCSCAMADLGCKKACEGILGCKQDGCKECDTFEPYTEEQ